MDPTACNRNEIVKFLNAKKMEKFELVVVVIPDRGHTFGGVSKIQ
jgi:hypothetical protein